MNGQSLATSNQQLATHSAPSPPHSIENDSLQPAGNTSAHTGTTQPAGVSAPVQLPGVGRVALALLIVIGGILLLRMLARKFLLLPGGVKSNKAVRVLSRSILAPKQHVVLLQVGKRVVVIADSAGRLSPLCEIADPDEVASLLSQVQNAKTEPAKAAMGFKKLFGRASEDFEAEPESLVDPPKEPSVTPVDSEELADLGHLLERVRAMQKQLR